MHLVICGKPGVGAALAKAPGVTERKDGYTEGDNVIVSWCIGHLAKGLFLQSSKSCSNIERHDIEVWNGSPLN
jgi:hypothetical protein